MDAKKERESEKEKGAANKVNGDERRKKWAERKG